MAKNQPALWDFPALRPLAPLVLAAWDDEWLTPAELLAIRDALEGSANVEPEAREVLQSWLNPEQPPTAAALRDLDREVRRTEVETWFSPQASSDRLSPGQLELLRSIDVRLPRTLPKTAPAKAEPVDISHWRALLDGDTRELRDATRSLLQDPQFRTLRDPEMHAYREQVLAWCKTLSGLPLFKTVSPEVKPSDVADFVACFETIAYFDLSLVVKFGVQFGLFAESIRNLGTAEHHALLPRIVRTEIMGCFAMTERGHGSNVRALQTTATYDPNTREFVIKTPSLAAGKEWIGNAARHARMAVVFAQLETRGEQCGVHAFLVPIRTEQGEMLPNVRAEDCGHKMGLNGVDNGRLWFDDVRVPRAALLDRFGHVAEDGTYTSPIPSAGKRFFTMLGTLVGGRINVAVGALAASKVGVSIALRYGMHRRQFPNAQGIETPIFNYLSHRQRLLPGLAAAYAFSFAQHALLRKLAAAKNDDPEQGRDIGTLAAGLKSLGTWQAIETLQHCRESCGGQGYLSANRIDALRTDADVFATFEGDNTVLLQLVAKDLLRARLRGFQEHPVRSVARAIVDNIGNAIAERNPVVTRRTDTDSLTSLEFQAQALRHRERSLTGSLSTRIQRRMGEGLNAQDAFEACQDHALALAKAHTEHFVFESFAEAAAGDSTLEALCALYGLGRLLKDMTWFVEDGYVASAKARAIRRQVNVLLGELAPHALPLTDAFGIPETCLGPLADPEYLRDSGLAPE
jgi:acyl-CoA oxidase